MTDRLTEMRKVYALRGDTYSSMEVVNLVGWGAEEIDRLRASNAELLAALKAYDKWADPVECGAPDLKPIRAQIRAAIAKAERK
jgi:hypothetical protein